MRLWSIYIAMPFFIVGMCLLGWAYEEKPSIAAVIFGWGMAEYAVSLTSVSLVLLLTRMVPSRFGILILTVATYNYLGNTFPQQQGEVSALINLARTIGGFGKSKQISFPVSTSGETDSSVFLDQPFRTSRSLGRSPADRSASLAWRQASELASSSWSLSPSRSTDDASGTALRERYSYQPEIPYCRKSCLYSYLCRVCMHFYRDLLTCARVRLLWHDLSRAAFRTRVQGVL